MPDPLQIQGMFPYKDGLAVFTTINTDRNSIGIIPIESTYLESPYCIQLSTSYWKGTSPIDMASTDEFLLVVCDGKRYIYEFPSEDADDPSKRIKVLPHDNQPATLCISTDKSHKNVVVGFAYGTITSGAVVMSLPDYAQLYCFDCRNRGIPRGFDFTSDSQYFNLLMYSKQMVTAESASGDVDRAELPIPSNYDCMCAIYVQGQQQTDDVLVACKNRNEGTSAIYRYVWDGKNKVYFSAGTILDGIDVNGIRNISITRDGGIANIKSKREVEFYKIV